MKIEINEEEVARVITETIARNIVTEHRSENREAKQGIKLGVEKAVKEFIYTQKERIIQLVIERATKELVRKALPILIDKNFTKEQEK